MNAYLYRDILAQVTSKNSELILEQEQSRYIYRINLTLDANQDPRKLKVPHNNGIVTLLVVYDADNRYIITALPPTLTVQQIQSYKRG